MKTSLTYSAYLIAALASGLSMTGCDNNKHSEAPQSETPVRAQYSERTDSQGRTIHSTRSDTPAQTEYTAQASPDRKMERAVVSDGSISEQSLAGKWSLNVGKTNGLNASKGPGAIASDLTKDVLGASWEFSPNGVMKIDTGSGIKTASYTVASNILAIKDPREISYELSFNNDSLVTREVATGQYRVFDRTN